MAQIQGVRVGVKVALWRVSPRNDRLEWAALETAMRLQRLATPTAFLLTLALATTTFAQPGSDSRRRGRETGSRDAVSSDQRGSRDVAVRRDAQRGGDRAARGSDNRGYDTRANDNRGYDTRGSVSRGNDNRRTENWRTNPPRYDSRYDTRRDYGRYDNRGSYGWNDHSYRRYGSYNRDAWRGRVFLGLGVSIFAGRPFSFHFDYGWRPSFAYHYPMRSGLVYGGMSFLLDPDYAEVYIDGQFAGIARDFGGQPVPVSVGYHRIELYAPGFAPVAFDITVRPGQVIPYRGSLYPAY